MRSLSAFATPGVKNMPSRAFGRAATMALFGRVSTLLIQSTQLAAASVKMPLPAYLQRFDEEQTLAENLLREVLRPEASAGRETNGPVSLKAVLGKVGTPGFSLKALVRGR